MEKDVAYRPYYCVWELTLACNLRCGHCGSSAGAPRPDELSTAECLDAVQQLADLECKLITLSGGEPTLRRDWDQIARAAVARGVVVNMVTNGTTMSRDLAARIRDAGLVNVAVSLDGTRANHEATRGRGTFDKVLRAIALLQDAKLPVTLITHLNQDTAAELEEVHALALSLGVDSWRVQLGKAMGNLADDRANLLEPRDLLSLIPRLARIKKHSKIWVDVGDSVGFYGPHERLLRQKRWGNMQPLWSGCQAGRFAIGLESDGGVKGCLSLQAKMARADGADPFREGSLRGQRLEDLWFAPGAFAFNREQTVDDLRGACRSCQHNALCRGGAKCVAAAFTNGVAEDPYCYHRVARELSLSHRAGEQIRQGAAAAIIGLGFGLGGLAGSGCVIVTPSDDDAAVTADAAATGDAASRDAALPEYCENVCCECDYGTPPPPECCEPYPPPADAGVDPDSGPCCEPEYGVPPPTDAGVAPDAADPCANVCCECEYGTPPPPECCASMDYGVDPPADAGPAPVDSGVAPADAGPAPVDAGVTPADAGPAPDAVADDVDPCANVCCMCDYGVEPIPEECCAAPEYGVLPPADAGVAPVDAGPAADAAKADVDPCANVCCDCDYGMPPPEECCP